MGVVALKVQVIKLCCREFSSVWGGNAWMDGIRTRKDLVNLVNLGYRLDVSQAR